ncbi:peptide chain release factor 1 [Roseomonas sp. NAR14]|uniref:Peptide chain release factor 1 n=1 Tax=Roseomonas acroporae TaxID=2937791 RepID=A0A9X1YDQ6_9PROT|nr:peptide chain release factor 1 [Roseomonas acroporae]MCK8787208.1 peptide chain release factor 1 [Roseomonas acroporae]
MTEIEFQTKLDELDRLLNDPDTRMDPHRIWSLLAEISEKSEAEDERV